MKAVLGAGALATAIGAVLALWPSPDPQDRASLSVRVISQVRLSEYGLRSSGGVAPATAGVLETRPPGDSHMVGLVPVRSVPLPRPVFAVAASSRTALLQDAQPTTPTPSPHDVEATGVPETGTSPADPTEQDEEEVETSQKEEMELTEDVLPILERELTGLGDCADTDCFVAMLPIVSSAAEPAGGASAEPEIVAEELIELFDQVRMVEDTPDAVEPVGVVVATDVELSGLRDQEVMLSWSIWPPDGQARLFGQWLATNPAYRLEATTDNDTGSLDVWIPLPREPGPYIVRMALTLGDTNLASAETEPFE